MTMKTLLMMLNIVINTGLYVRALITIPLGVTRT